MVNRVEKKDRIAIRQASMVGSAEGPTYLLIYIVIHFPFFLRKK